MSLEDIFVKNTLPIKQGDQIGLFFCQFGYFWMPIVTFWKEEVAQDNGDILDYFLLWHFLHLHLNKHFQNMVCWGILRLQKCFFADVSGIQIGL